MNNRKRILIIGEVFSENLGDGLICSIVKNLFDKNLYDVTLLDMSNREYYTWDEISEDYNLKRKYIMHFKSILRRFLNVFGINMQGKYMKERLRTYEINLISNIELIRPDAIVFAGGQMFMSCFLSRLNEVVKLAEKMEIPVFFNACGYGYINKRERLVLKSILNRKVVKYISIRDGAEKISSLGINKEVIVTYDTALLTSNYFESHKTNSNNNIGLGIMFSEKYTLNEQLLFWRRIIDNCIERKLEWKVFTNGSSEDEEFARYVLKSSGIMAHERMCIRSKLPEELIELITSFDTIISMRLHSLIIAYSMGIPAVAISWDNKVNEFYDKIGMEDYCFNLYSDIDLIIDATFKIKNDRRFNRNKKYIINDISKNFTNLLGVIERGNN